VGLLSHERFDDFDDLLLLTAWHARHGLEKLAGTATRSGDAGRLGLTEQLLDGYTERLGHGDQNIRPGQVAARLPVQNIGVLLANLTGQLTHG
jgi:hypothetical protein